MCVKRSSSRFLPSWNYNYEKKLNKTGLRRDKLDETDETVDIIVEHEISKEKEIKPKFEHPVTYKNGTDENDLDELLQQNSKFVENFEKITHHHIFAKSSNTHNFKTVNATD